MPAFSSVQGARESDVLKSGRLIAWRLARELEKGWLS